MVDKLVDYLGADPGKLYCVGDNQNDIPMLERSVIPFAPAVYRTILSSPRRRPLQRGYPDLPAPHQAYLKQWEAGRGVPPDPKPTKQ